MRRGWRRVGVAVAVARAALGDGFGANLVLDGYIEACRNAGDSSGQDLDAEAVLFAETGGVFSVRSPQKRWRRLKPACTSKRIRLFGLSWVLLQMHLSLSLTTAQNSRFLHLKL